MFDLSAIKSQALQLRPTSTRDLSAPHISQSDFELTDQLQATVLDINIEQWYDLLEPVTFKTEFFELTKEDGELFRDGYLEYEAFLAQQQGKSADAADASSTAAGSKCSAAAAAARTKFVPSPAIASRIAALAARMQVVVDRVNGTSASASASASTSASATSTTVPPRTPPPVFVKTSCRSAKDAPTSQLSLQTHFNRLASESASKDDNALIGCMLEAGLELLKVYSAAEALNLFIRSERVYQDMLLALQHGDRWEQNVAIRQWVDIKVSQEYRGFVKDGKLTAVSQYNHLCAFPDLVGDIVQPPPTASATATASAASASASESSDGARARLLPAVGYVQELSPLVQRLKTFFYTHCRDQLAPRFTDYVVDFAITEHGDDVVVIELNPFLETTDGCLFSWTKERDLIEGKHGSTSTNSTIATAAGESAGGGVGGGEEDPHFRVRFLPEKGAKSLLASDWRELLEGYNAAAAM